MTENIDSPPPKRWKPAFTRKNVFISAVIVVLLAALITCVLLWRPWQSKTGERTVNVTGQTTIKAEPDEYLFTPNYKFTGDSALEQATKKSSQVVDELKKIGIEENYIKSNINGGEEYLSSEGDQRANAYNLSLRITVKSKDQADRVQAYLIKAKPLGSVSPQASFSEEKRKMIEQQARDEAIKDAISKAEQNAKQLGFQLGKVKEITDGNGFGAIPYSEPVYDAYGPVPDILPGLNDLNYSVNVIFYVK